MNQPSNEESIAVEKQTPAQPEPKPEALFFQRDAREVIILDDDGYTD